jgi:hypothetical protein
MSISRSSHRLWPAVSASGAASELSVSVQAEPTQLGPPRALRLEVFLRRGKLDRQIASAGTSELTDALSLRICQLTEASMRRRTARELRGVVERVDDREPGLVISAVVIEPAAVRAGREALLGLAERLESSAPVSACGVALARALLTEADSPLYNPYCERTVNEAVFEVQDALGGPPAFGLPAVAV